MKETFGQKTRRSHKRNQRVVMIDWCPRKMCRYHSEIRFL